MEEDIKILLRYVKQFFLKKKLIFFVLGCSFLFGVIYIFVSKKEYLSETIFVGQMTDGQKVGNGIKNIAKLVGFSVGNDGQRKDIPVYLYPKLLQSIRYNKALLSTKVSYENINVSITLKEYLLKRKEEEINFSFIKKIFRKDKSDTNAISKLDSLNYLTGKERIAISELQKSLNIAFDEEDGSISISFIATDPIVATQVTESAKSILQKEIINYRIQKSKEQYDFIDSQYSEKKTLYLNAQTALASYIDKNRYNNTELSLLRKRALENEVNIAYTIYSELEAQRLREQIKIKEDTPVFVTLQEAIIPSNDTASNPLITIFKFVFVGFILALFIFIFITIRNAFKDLWKSL